MPESASLYPAELDTDVSVPDAPAKFDGSGTANAEHSTLHNSLKAAVLQLEEKVGLGTGKMVRGVTRVVAPADAPTDWLNQADIKLLGDATDYSQILTAMAEGGPTLIGPGTVVVDATTQVVNGGIFTHQADGRVLMGCGYNTILDFIVGQGLNDRYMLALLGSGDYALKGCMFAGFRITLHDAQHHGWRASGYDHGNYIGGVWIEHDGAGATSTDEGVQFTPVAGSGRGLRLGMHHISGVNLGMELRAGASELIGVHGGPLYFDGCRSAGLQIKTPAGANHPRDFDLEVYARAMTKAGADGIVLDGGQDGGLRGSSTENPGDGIVMVANGEAPLRYHLDGMILSGNGASGLVHKGDRHRFNNIKAISNVNGIRGEATNSWITDSDALSNSGHGIRENNSPAGNKYQRDYASGNGTDWEVQANHDATRTAYNEGTGAP